MKLDMLKQTLLVAATLSLLSEVGSAGTAGGGGVAPVLNTPTEDVTYSCNIEVKQNQFSSENQWVDLEGKASFELVYKKGDQNLPNVNLKNLKWKLSQEMETKRNLFMTNLDRFYVGIGYMGGDSTPLEVASFINYYAQRIDEKNKVVVSAEARAKITSREPFTATLRFYEDKPSDEITPTTPVKFINDRVYVALICQRTN